MDLLLWLPRTDEDVRFLSEDALSRIVESRHNDMKCTAIKLDVYVNPDGRRSQTFWLQCSAQKSGKTIEPTIFSFDNAN